MRLGLSSLLLLALTACSGQRDDSLDRRINTAEVDGGSATAPDTTPPITTPPAGAPVRSVVVGVNGGQAQSARFRAQVLVSFPHQPAPSASAHHSATLLPRSSP
jgi:hypothetical protein